MQKIPTLFIRNPTDMRTVTRELTLGCEWVLAGEGRPTVKKDGTNVRVDVKGGQLQASWKRRNPTREEKAQGVEPGYIPLKPDDPNDRHMHAAIQATAFTGWPDGEHSCEALGPKIQGGVESATPQLYAFTLQPEALSEDPRTYDALQAFFTTHVIEGIVWHHPDGRMAKIKRRDFGLEWRQSQAWRAEAKMKASSVG